MVKDHLQGLRSRRTKVSTWQVDTFSEELLPFPEPLAELGDGISRSVTRPEVLVVLVIEVLEEDEQIPDSLEERPLRLAHSLGVPVHCPSQMSDADESLVLL